MVICAMVGCSNRTCWAKSTNRNFFRLPKIVEHQGQRTKELCERRRRLWLARINRSDLNEGAGVRVCGAHFVMGRPAKLWQEWDPDWAPSLLLGYSAEHGDRLERVHAAAVSPSAEPITEEDDSDREESKQLPRAPPPPPPPPAAHPVAAEQGQLLLLLKQNGPCQPQRLLLPRLQQQVQLRLGTPGEAASVFVTAAGSPLPPAAAAAGAVHAQGTTPPNGVLLEPAGAVASGQQPEPDTGPPAAGTEEHFRAQMLHQTSQQTALLQGLLEEQRRIAEAAERQARALEEQSHAVSQLLLLMMGNQRHAAASSALLPDTPIALLTPDMVQVQHATPSAS
ncbi:uncharacterized protein LOC144141336 isoform X6 [Haemaphysalis longicornis]